MILVEALNCGTKIVSSNCNFGPSEILVGEYSKFLVEPDNIQDYIEKIKIALNDYPKETNIIVEKCDPANIIKEYIKFMNE